MCIIIYPCAIIAEYNPFHNGHMYHINKTKELLGDVPIICIMSGHFTQRGEPAIADKWTRASWAIELGCDAVIELPAVYAIQSANRFAGGSVKIAAGISGVSHLSFGSETDDLMKMQDIAAYKNTQEYSTHLNLELKSGSTFARAQQVAIGKLGQKKDLLLDSPNCILALEYLGYLADTNITPLAIKRTSNGHSDGNLQEGITSATSIRRAVSESLDISSCVPSSVAASITGTSLVTLDSFTPIILSKIYSLKEDGLKNIHEVNEGLENRIYKEAIYSKSITELIERVKTKRYPYTRLQRTMLYILLDITKDFMKEIDEADLPVYARLLAVNTKCSSILKPTDKVPILSKAADYKSILNPLQQKIFQVDMLATAMYSLFSPILPSEDLVHQIIKSRF